MHLYVVSLKSDDAPRSRRSTDNSAQHIRRYLASKELRAYPNGHRSDAHDFSKGAYGLSLSTKDGYR